MGQHVACAFLVKTPERKHLSKIKKCPILTRTVLKLPEIPELKIESKTETLHLPKENLSLHSKPKMSKKLLFNPIFASSIDHKKILQRQNEISEKKQTDPQEKNHDLELENCIEPDSLDTQPNLLKFLKHLTYVYLLFSVFFS